MLDLFFELHRAFIRVKIVFHRRHLTFFHLISSKSFDYGSSIMNVFTRFFSSKIVRRRWLNKTEKIWLLKSLFLFLFFSNRSQTPTRTRKWIWRRRRRRKDHGWQHVVQMKKKRNEVKEYSIDVHTNASFVVVFV